MTERKLYLDHIRWSTVLLVMFYHVCYLFNDVGILEIGRASCRERV